MLNSVITAAAIGIGVVEALKIGVISDMHTNLDYDAWAGAHDNCVTGSSTKESIQAPLARSGCDPSKTLVDFML